MTKKNKKGPTLKKTFTHLNVCENQTQPMLKVTNIKHDMSCISPQPNCLQMASLLFTL